MNIEIIGAKEHNLQNISLKIPRNKIVVFTGVSGSGKSSLAFDTIFAAAQREFFESLSSYARKALPRISSPNVDAILGLSPAILIDQKPLARNPRSTVGTVTEAYTFLRLLYSRLGTPSLSASNFSFNTPAGACKTCTGLGVELVPDLEKLLDRSKSLNDGAILHRTWRVGSRYWNILQAIGLFDMDKSIKDYTNEEVKTLLYSEPVQYQNKEPGYVQSFSYEGVIRRLISRQGDSRGLEGNAYDQKFFALQKCSECEGSRLNAEARSVTINGKTIVEMATSELTDLLSFMDGINDPIARTITPYISKVIGNLIESGVGYLTMNRSVATLSGGEAQKVKLSRHLGSSLTELIYVLDEPSAGLHAKDINHLHHLLKDLSEKPNTIIVVEHDQSVMLNADWIVDLGPGAGVHGGNVVAEGTPLDVMKSDSITGRYLSGKSSISVKEKRRIARDHIEIKNANLHNLKEVTVSIPKNVLTCLTGVSGSGKSSLVEVLLKQYSKVIVVDQSPIGTSPRSNPATYAKAFDDIRKEFANGSGQNPSLFTFNSKGACEVCEGLGYIRVDMHFLGDVRQLCKKCNGNRYNDFALQFTYKKKNIAQVLDMTIEEALDFFDNSSINRKLRLFIDIGLGYLKLGQPLDTLSGGEAQRVKLVSRLSIKGNIYVLDEPTRGLHFADIDRLLTILNKLIEATNTVIVVEHNLDVIKNADWIIDLGPDGGSAGGQIVAQGPPEVIAASKRSYTGHFLSELISDHSEL